MSPTSSGVDRPAPDRDASMSSSSRVTGTVDVAEHDTVNRAGVAHQHDVTPASSATWALG